MESGWSKAARIFRSAAVAVFTNNNDIVPSAIILWVMGLFPFECDGEETVVQNVGFD
jgi:hypothetical protein